MSNEYRHVELLTGDVRRRRWTTEQKLTIIEQSFEPGETVSSTARRHGVAPNLLDRVPLSSLIAVVKLVGAGIAGQAHGSLRGRHFDRLIMALDRLSRPMWCSRLSGRTSTRIPGIGLDCATVLTGRSRWYQLTCDIGINHASSLGPCYDQRKGSPEIHIA